VEGPQHLQITFENAEGVGDEEVRKHPEHDWFTLNSVSRLAIRKAQYHYVSPSGTTLFSLLADRAFNHRVGTGDRN
jgi:hypothetical protein